MTIRATYDALRDLLGERSQSCRLADQNTHFLSLRADDMIEFEDDRIR